MEFTSKRKKSRTSSVLALLSLMAYVVLTSLSAWAALSVKAESSISGRTRIDKGFSVRPEPARGWRVRYLSASRQVPNEKRREVAGFEKTEAGKLEVSEESVGCGERIELRSSAFRFASSHARLRKPSLRPPRIGNRTGRNPILAPQTTSQTSTNLIFLE